MNPTIINLNRYLHATLDITVSPTPWGGAAQLPIHLRDSYTFYEAKLLGTSCLLVLDLNRSDRSPAAIRKHLDLIRASWAGELVYVRDRITAYNRQRLIEQKVSFVVPANQMYLPLLGLDLREHFKRQRLMPRKFSPSTQALVVGLLHRGIANMAFSPAEMATQLGYSAMTMTRAFDELEAADIGEVFHEGRDRKIGFSDPEHVMWAKTLPFLRSPVRKRIHIEPSAENPPGPRAGLTALADCTMLAEPSNPVIAVFTRNRASFLQSHRITACPFREPGGREIEIWSYDPNLFAVDNRVDRLSLYLSLRDNPDERVAGALEEMMAGMPCPWPTIVT